MGARFSSKMSTGQAGMIGLIMPDQSLAQQQAQQARETIIPTCGGVCGAKACVGCKPATGLGMQLQKSARPDLRAGVVGLEGCGLYLAQPRPCQPAFSVASRPSERVCFNFDTKTGQGLTPPCAR